MARRTGLRTIHAVTQRLCQLLATWTPALLLIIPPEKHVYIHALNQACSDFVGNVSASQILGDEVP